MEKTLFVAKKAWLVALFVIVVTGVRAACDPINKTWLTSSETSLGEMTTDDGAVWFWDGSYHCAVASKQGGYTGWLLTPAQDLTGADVISFSFNHAHKFAGTASEELTLWITSNYTGDVSTSSWKQLTISPYSAQSDWKFLSVTISVPKSYVGANTVFGFKYISTASNNAKWEIKEVNLSATFDCGSSSSGLKVCGQNLLNYYYNWNSCDRSSSSTEEQFNAKTTKIVNSVLSINADIYAFCELEAKPIVLQYLVKCINDRIGTDRFAYVVESIDEDPESYTDANNLKSGFIYRKDKVRPIGESYAASTAYYYQNTMRIQTFEEIATGERFVLSMNHFKAKDSTSDQGNSKREGNAKNLINTLKNVSIDPDILIMGDLNCTYDESPLQMIVNAGYEEQLLAFHSDAYSYCYKSSTPQLIDHVLANSSMANQIVNAQVVHTCTTCGGSSNYSTKYSDHDPYYVELLLSSGSSECQKIDETHLVTGGTDYDMGKMSQVSVSGSYKWNYRSSYGATCQDKGGEDWLLTPTYDMSKAKAIRVSFEHAINYANLDNMSNEMTMWITPSFESVGSSEWTQLTIPTYPDGASWNFVSTYVDIPTSQVGKNTVIAFRYKVASEAINKPNWEIKNLRVQASCNGVLATDEVAEANQVETIRLIENGQLIIVLPDGTKYNVMGTRVK